MTSGVLNSTQTEPNHLELEPVVILLEVSLIKNKSIRKNLGFILSTNLNLRKIVCLNFSPKV